MGSLHASNVLFVCTKKYFSIKLIDLFDRN